MSTLVDFLSPHLTLIAGVIVFLLFVTKIGLTIARRFSRFKGPARYSAKPLMTGAEQRMYGLLKKACPQYDIVPQVAMGALVKVASWQNKGKDGWKYRAAFAQKILDYVIYDPEQHRVVCVVELDDKTHDSRAAQARDGVKNDVLRQAGISLVRFDARAMPDIAEIRKRCL